MLLASRAPERVDSVRMSSEATTSSWLATYIAARAPITVVTPELPDASRRSAEPHLNFRRQNGSWLCARLAAGLNQSPRVRTRFGSLCSGRGGGPTEWSC